MTLDEAVDLPPVVVVALVIAGTVASTLTIAAGVALYERRQRRRA